MELESGLRAITMTTVTTLLGTLPLAVSTGLEFQGLQHTRIAAALEQKYADRLESQFALLADHYERGGLWPKALEYRQKAGARAQRLYDNSVAVAHLTRAFTSCQCLMT